MRIRPTRNKEEEEVVVFLVRIEGIPPNMQHAQHRPVQATDRREPSPVVEGGTMYDDVSILETQPLSSVL